MLPLTAGFLIMGPLSGILSDRYGARFFSTAGMFVAAVAFIGLISLPTDFNYIVFAFFIMLVGMGMGMFAAPNTTAIMNSVPPEHRGASSGMLATFQNTANSLSITFIFTIVTIGLATSLPTTLFQGLTNAGIPAVDSRMVANIPPTAALFAAFLGYNPLATILPAPIIKLLPSAEQAQLLGKTFFPNLLSGPFESGLRVAFSISAFLMVVAAMASWLRGKKYMHNPSDPSEPEPVPPDDFPQ
jgi:MFS family permease